MRVSIVCAVAMLLLSACGQPEVAKQGATTATRPPYPVATEQPYPGPMLQSPYPVETPTPLSAEQIVRLRATNLPPCPAPTATETPPPTATPVPPGTILPTWMPVPIPSPAPFPGDFKLALSACAVQGSAPQTVRFSAVLTGGPDNSYELFCVGPDWQFGDGSGMTTWNSCVAWSPDMRIQRTFTTDYTYKQPGTYQARLRIGSRSGGTLVSNAVTITVQ